MFKAIFYPRKVKFYTDNVRVSVTNFMSGPVPDNTNLMEITLPWLQTGWGTSLIIILSNLILSSLILSYLI